MWEEGLGRSQARDVCGGVWEGCPILPRHIQGYWIGYNPPDFSVSLLKIHANSRIKNNNKLKSGGGVS